MHVYLVHISAFLRAVTLNFEGLLATLGFETDEAILAFTKAETRRPNSRCSEQGHRLFEQLVYHLSAFQIY